MSIASIKRCWAEVDLATLERNIGKIRASLPHYINYLSVVKADAYGHGMPHVVSRLMRSLIYGFAVATVSEAITIRELGVGWPILVLSPILPDERYVVLEYDLMVTISGEEELKWYNNLGIKYKKKIGIHLKVDTGMGRAGVWFDKALELYQAILEAEYLELKGIYTHFSCAGLDQEFTTYQRNAFEKTLKTLSILDHKKLIIHTDNSAGFETFSPNDYVNTVRIGILQFGISSSDKPLNNSIQTDPVLSLRSRISLIKNLPKDSSISYGRTYKLKRESKIALIAAGYGDGIPLALSNRGEVLIRDKRYPIIGRVTMDQTIIDITGSQGDIQVGDRVTFIGRDVNEEITVKEWSCWADTIVYDIYCSLTKRVPRIYRNDTFS